DDNADGTYEHPYSASDFNQQVLQNINSFTHSHGMSNADLYLNQGTYRDVSGKPWDLPAGQSVWGRMGAYKGYQEPAQGDSRPLLIGSFKMESDTGLDSIKLENDYANTGMEA
ncbi:MAG: hypothetical protein GTN53_00425, partial [Candidatus Aminicenantes bacterium]|nr:hypothetical protein [Candidatus Aminicenantes bacterium]